jgi:hypothetical protein
MAAYKTRSISAATRWVDACHGLGTESRSNLVNILNSPQFRAALGATGGGEIVIEYDQAADLSLLPRRVLLDVHGQGFRVAITGDRGSWILDSTARQHDSSSRSA